MAWQQRRQYGARAWGNGGMRQSVQPDVKPVGFAPSKYQTAILEWFRNETGNAIIQAVAGSGKTSTLVMLAREMKGADAVFLAFNKSIAEELKSRLPANVQASTFHALGFRAIRPTLEKMNGRPWDFRSRERDNVTDRKVGDIFDRLYVGETGEGELKPAREAVCKLVGLMKHTLLREDADDDTLSGLMARFDVDCDDPTITDDAIMSCARSVLAESNRTTDCIDFNDQLYMVWLFDCDVSGGGAGYQYVMVDECQDTNAARREILRRLLSVRKGSRLVAVGDEYQAIYGFTGADSDSMQRIRDGFQCVTLPLSVSYRCDRAIVEEAQQYVPGIEVRDGASDGSVKSVGKWSVEEWRRDDMVICRNTAPLIGMAYKCIRGRVACRVMGRDIGAGLVSLVKRLAGKGKDADSVGRLIERVEEWRQMECERVSKMKGGEGRLQSVEDKADSLVLLCEAAQDAQGKDASVQRGVIEVLEDMFSDKSGVLTFSTVHKAKGMEADRVFVLDRGLMPSKYARQEWQQVQERNLMYVAVTRAKRELVYVDSVDVQ